MSENFVLTVSPQPNKLPLIILLANLDLQEKKIVDVLVLDTTGVNSFVLVCSLSSHRHLFIPLIFGSRFIDS